MPSPGGETANSGTLPRAEGATNGACAEDPDPQLPLADIMAASTNFERFPGGTVSTISLAARLSEKIRTTRVLPRRLPRLRPAPLRRPPLRPLIPAIFYPFYLWCHDSMARPDAF